MSDYLAVGGVSAVLKALLTAALSEGGPSTVLLSPPGVTNRAPDLIPTSQDEPAQLNLFMYYASINPALRNLGLPSMSSSGAQLGNPPLAINLHYLVTAYGANPFDPEILLGFAMQVFHNTPVVPRSAIQTALTALDAGAPTNEQQLVSASTLASQIEHIRITPEALTTEEIYRLWTAFQVSYRPTTSYQVSVVVIQGTQSYQSNLPVQKRALVAMPLTGPMIASVSPQMISAGQTMTINGSNFLTDTPSDTLVSFNDGKPIAAATVQGNCVRVNVPATLAAGVSNVRVMCNVTFPSSSTPHPCFASNPVPFQLIPTVEPPTLPAMPPYQAMQGQPLAINVSPAVGNTQTVVVYIGDQAIPQTPGALGPPSTSTVVSVTVPSTIAVGTYPLRVEVDGAQSLLTQDTNQASPTYGQWLPQVEVSA
ncbi:MAG: Pvc16 family protein [Terracidiphilus sp.]